MKGKQMEPSQIKHLREAASDIRYNLSTAEYKLLDIKEAKHQAERIVLIDSIAHKMQSIERALTRIEMCLKDVT
jgi:hypothetical protein